jgi:hypothetical protein
LPGAINIDLRALIAALATGRGTTEIGYRNRNSQVVVRPTDLAGTDHNQKIYVLRCDRCGFEYGANGSDIFERKCPSCQQGQPGLEFD